MDGREPKMSGSLREKKSSTKNQSDKKSPNKIQFKLNLIFKTGAVLAFLVGVAGSVVVISRNHIPTSVSAWFDPQKFGFTCTTIRVEGLKYANIEDIKNMIPLKVGHSIFSESPENVREIIEKNSWIRTAVVRRKLPDTLIVRVVEYQPVAYWQMNSKLFLIDNNGVIIEGERHQNLTHLPVITGEKAAEKFPLLMKELADFPDIYNRMTGAVFISKRRWDIILDAKLKVKLPEQGIQQAMRYLTNLEGDHALASKDISSVDLRIPDRAFFTLSENARMMKFYNSKDKQA